MSAFRRPNDRRFLGALVASAVHGRLHLPPPDCRRLAPTLFTAILHDHLDILTFVSPEFLAGGCCRRNTDSLDRLEAER